MKLVFPAITLLMLSGILTLSGCVPATQSASSAVTTTAPEVSLANIAFLEK